MKKNTLRSRVGKLLTKLNTPWQPDEVPMGAQVPSAAGAHVSEESAMRLAAVNACVRVLAEDVAILPLHLYKRAEDGGKERAKAHPLYTLLRYEPNPEMDSMAFKQAIMVNLLLEGNGYALREYRNDGRLKALWPVISSNVEPRRDSLGRLHYMINGMRAEADEVWHVPGLSFNGIRGMNPIEYARESIGTALAAETFGAKLFSNGTNIGGIITVQGRLSEEAFERTKTQFNQMYRGLQNAHGVALLEDGSKFEKIGMSSKDAQFLETRKFQRTEIAAMFRVPLHMIGDLEHATFSNIEHQDISYLQRSLTPWLTRIERAAHRQLLSEAEKAEYIVEHETSGFLRGDTLTRYQAYSTAIQAGFLMPNEARVADNRNPAEGGWTLMRPLNMEAAGGAGTSDKEPESGRRSKYARFFRGSERRTAKLNRKAANAIADEIMDAMREAISTWISAQAVALMAILTEGNDRAATHRVKPGALGQKIQSFYADLDAVKKFPGWKDAEKQIENCMVQAVREAAAELKAPALAEKDMKQMLAKISDEIARRSAETLRKDLQMIESSKNGKGGEAMSALSQRLSEWHSENHEFSEKLAQDALHKATCETRNIYFRKKGYFSIWTAAAAECPACQHLNGEAVVTLTPPLHEGCRCTITCGDKWMIPPLTGEGSGGKYDNAGFKDLWHAAAHLKHLKEYEKENGTPISFEEYVNGARRLLNAEENKKIFLEDGPGGLERYNVEQNDYVVARERYVEGRIDGYVLLTRYRPSKQLPLKPWIRKRLEQ